MAASAWRCLGRLQGEVIFELNFKLVFEGELGIC